MLNDNNKGFARLGAFKFGPLLGISLLTLASFAPISLAEDTNGIGKAKIKVQAAHRGETYEEEQERLAREKQMQDDLDAYLERWRGDKAAPSFCSIAYSKTSYRWGFAWGKDSRGRAQNEAAKRCGPGAEILCWSKGTSYCALADGPRSYGGAPGNTAQQAKTAALNYANKVAPGARIVLVIGGNPAKIWQAK